MPAKGNNPALDSKLITRSANTLKSLETFSDTKGSGLKSALWSRMLNT